MSEIIYISESDDDNVSNNSSGDHVFLGKCISIIFSLEYHSNTFCAYNYIHIQILTRVSWIKYIRKDSPNLEN